MRAKLGLPAGDDERDDQLIVDWLQLLHAQRIDHTIAMRSLSRAVRGDQHTTRTLFGRPGQFDAWAQRWSARVASQGRAESDVAEQMDAVNPVYIPRNHQVEAVLTAAIAGDLAPFDRLMKVLAHPFDERSGQADFATGAPAGSGAYRTFCGT